MLLGLIGVVFSAWLGFADPSARSLPAVTFNPRERAVSNWRWQAAGHLDQAPGMALSLVLGRDPRAVTRCVRLNNYWCIKRAGWAGEIAADAEGHVAFASALEGADVAALLLRRYYVGYGRHSAFAIVSHWAPAGCGAPAAALGGGNAGPRLLRAQADHLTTRGLGHTLRARFLADRGRRVAGRGRVRAKPSVVPDPLIGARTATPAIALGLDAAPLDLGLRSLSALPPLALGPALSAGAPERACVGDGVRIAAYAAKAAAGVAPNAGADLKLFDAAGLPTANLGKVMHNMSAVEIGPLGADPALIAAAVEHVREVAAAPPAAPLATR